MSKSHTVGWASDAPTPAQLKEFFAQVASGRVTKDRLQVFLRGDDAAADYLVTVDYSQSLADMLAAGRYDWKNSDINDENFPHDRKRGVETVAIELVHFDRIMTSDDVLRELDQRGLRAATLPEGLALAVLDPDLQRKFPIVLLGFVLQDRGGGRGVPYLWSDSDVRRLDLAWFEGGWRGYCRFAAVRK